MRLNIPSLSVLVDEQDFINKVYREFWPAVAPSS